MNGKAWGEAQLTYRKIEMSRFLMSFMKASGLSNAKLSQAVGVSRETIRKIIACDVENLSFDLMYVVAMQLEANVVIKIPSERVAVQMAQDLQNAGPSAL